MVQFHSEAEQARQGTTFPDSAWMPDSVGRDSKSPGTPLPAPAASRWLRAIDDSQSRLGCRGAAVCRTQHGMARPPTRQAPGQSKKTEAVGHRAEILFRGELVRLEAGLNGATGAVVFGGEIVRVPDIAGDLRPWIVKHLWKLAAKEFPPKVYEFATAHQMTVSRVTVRNQRSRWGSCSRRGTISLNWRLIQTPPFVRDYIFLHELMHLRQMNHSVGFWREVESVCPFYKAAEKWVKQHSDQIAGA